MLHSGFILPSNGNALQKSLEYFFFRNVINKVYLLLTLLLNSLDGRRRVGENVLFHRLFIIMRQFEEAYVKTNILNGFYEMHIEIIKNVL